MTLIQRRYNVIIMSRVNLTHADLSQYSDNSVFVQVMFNRYGYDYYLSTEVNVIPDNYPVDECYAEECFSKLV